MKAKKTTTTTTRKELCGAIIALARLVNKEAGGREIYFINEETQESIYGDKIPHIGMKEFMEMKNYDHNER